MLLSSVKHENLASCPVESGQPSALARIGYARAAHRLVSGRATCLEPQFQFTADALSLGVGPHYNWVQSTIINHGLHSSALGREPRPKLLIVNMR